MKPYKGCLFAETKRKEGDGCDILPPLRELCPRISSRSLRRRCGVSEEMWKLLLHLVLGIKCSKAPPEETAKDKGLAGEVSASTKKGRTVSITAEDMQKRKNDVKAKTTLMLALPDEHQLRLSKYDSAKELWEAILKTFSGNEATKKTKKNQLKDDLDTMSLDDVYNHLKVYELEVQKRVGSNSQNMAFISSSNTNSGKSEVPTVQGVSTASAQVSTDSTNVAAASLSYDTICVFIATQPNVSQIKYEDISQIDDDDIEEIDIKWNLALLSMRADSCHKMGYFSRECISPRSQDRGTRESYKKDPKVEDPTPKAMIAIDGIGWDWSYMVEEDEASKNHALVADEEELKDNKIEYLRNELEEVKKEKESIDFKIEKFKNASKDIDRILESQKLDKDKKGVGFNEYCAAPPPPKQVYSHPKKDLSWMGLPKFVDDTVTDYSRPTPSIDVSKSGIPQNNIDDKGYWDSGCSRHMTGNISYLSEYEPFNGGYVSFGHGRGKITGKGSIKTDKLEFVNVYFVEELKYNQDDQNWYTMPRDYFLQVQSSQLLH
nr:ribonuclease H-like domain-containing protein [Tanacetum cinerariifolium]